MVVYYTNEGFFDAETNTYVVAIIDGNEPGYWVHAAGWPTIEAAKAEAARMNAARGITEDQVLTAVASSMARSNRGPRS